MAYITKAEFTARATGISAQAISSGAGYLGSAVDNATTGDDVLNLEVVWSFSVAPTANKTCELWLLYSYDGANFEDGDASTAPLNTARLLRSWSPPADTSTHRFFVWDYPLASKKFKLLVRNVDTGQTITVTVNAETARLAQVTD